MDNCLKNNLFPFYLKMYPQSEESEINLSLLNSISETDNFLSNKNDLVFRSGVKFGFSESKDYYSKIMKFLNYVIDLPNETIENLTGQKTTLGEEFFSDV